MQLDALMVNPDFFVLKLHAQNALFIDRFAHNANFFIWKYHHTVT